MQSTEATQTPITADVAGSFLSEYLTKQKEDYGTHVNLRNCVMYLVSNAKENEDRKQAENQP